MRELGDAAIHPNSCMGWSDAQYDHAAQWEALHPAAFNRVPSRFDESALVDWTPVRSLTTDRVRYLPTGYCYYGAPSEQDPPACRAISNGCAAGTTLAEAVLQGTLELVERDAVAMWWYSRVAGRASTSTASPTRTSTTCGTSTPSCGAAWPCST